MADDSSKLLGQEHVRLAHGKLTNIQLPSDWKRFAGDNVSKFHLQKNGDSVMNGANDMLITITSVPPKKPGQPDDPDGHTEFLYLSEKTRKKVFNYPGFPRPILNPKVPKHEVRDAPGKGLGVYATCDIYPGDLIWSERPYVVQSKVIVPPRGFKFGEHHTELEVHALRALAAEYTARAIADRLTPERKAGFMSLYNSHKEDGSGPCLGVLRTNQLEIPLLELDPSEDPDQIFHYCATGVDLSRTNHSCIPNIKHNFDFASFSLRIYAWGRIKKGDELVWSYVPHNLGTQERQKELSPYGFRCTCWACKTGASNKQFDAIWKSYTTRCYALAAIVVMDFLREDLGPKPWHKKTPAEKKERMKDYQSALSNLEQILKEGAMYGYVGNVCVSSLVHEIYKRIGDDAKRRRAANMVVRYLKCFELEKERSI